jgi:hypothetical protein
MANPAFFAGPSNPGDLSLLSYFAASAKSAGFAMMKGRVVTEMLKNSLILPEKSLSNP